MAECRVNVGNVEVIGLTDAEVGGRVKVTDLLPETPMEAIAPYRERYPEAFSTPDTWQAHFGCYLLRSDGKTILVDTGLGDRKSNPNTLAGLFNNEVEGRLMDELGSAGVSPTDIDTVVLTHLHSDHVGWNLVHEGGTPALRFRKAKYLIHQNDWNAFQTPDIQSRYPFSWWDDTLGPLETLGALDLVSGEQVLTSEVTIIETHGHTPGQVSLAISSQGQRGLVMGDVAIHVTQITEVDWRARPEIDPPHAARTREAFLNRAEAENAVVFACHFPRRGFGRIVRSEGRRYWQGL